MKTRKLLLIAALAAPLTFGAVPLLAQGLSSETVQFDAGTTGTTIHASITGDEIVDYKLSVSAGQMMSVSLKTTNPSNYFNIMAPGADAALFMGASAGTVYSGVLPSSGEYTIRVYLMRNAARRNETAEYDLVLSVTGSDSQPSASTPSDDYADGLAGGPDHWKVTGLSTSETLNLRSGAGTEFDIVAKLNLAEVLENKGCTMNGDTKWCQVKRVSDGLSGWVSGQYLRETAIGAVSLPSTPTPQANGLVGNGEPFSATGEIPCSDAKGQPTRNCPFGVVRTDVPGNASVWVGLPSGEERFIMFENGAPGFTNAQDDPVVEKSGDLNLISIGNERFEIPDAVVFGG